MLAIPVHAQDQVVPPLVEQINKGDWLPQAEAESSRDELNYQRSGKQRSSE